MTRYHRASMHQVPEVRTCGSFSDDSERLSWIQPSDLWQAQLLLHRGSFTFNGLTMAIEPFDLVIVPPGSRCEVERFGQEEYVYDFIGFAPVAGERDIVSLPLKTNLGDSGHFWDLELRKALNRIQFSRTSAHSVAWSLLWSVAQSEHVALRSVYTEQAEKLIEDRIGEKLRVSDLCKELSISQSQLTRLFLHELGRTPLQYIKDRRAHHAHRLLTRTTVAIKQVAVNCGIPNVHQFNQFVRDRYGESPRSLRQNRGVVDLYRVGDLKKARAIEE